VFCVLTSNFIAVQCSSGQEVGRRGRTPLAEKLKLDVQEAACSQVAPASAKTRGDEGALVESRVCTLVLQLQDLCVNVVLDYACRVLILLLQHLLFLC